MPSSSNFRGLNAADRDPLSLHEVSERLGFHYMTVYRYVRTGRLRASQVDGVWRVMPRDLAHLQATMRRKPARGRPDHLRRVSGLVERLVASDESGAWALVEALLAAGAAPVDIYSKLFIPALRLIGTQWEAGRTSVADEHGATVTMHRLIGRMGPFFRRRGRTRGVVVIGTPEGELHSLPTALAADLLRAQGFRVLDLGANTPTSSFVDYVVRLPSVVGVGIAVTTSGQQEMVEHLVSAHRRAHRMPIIVGGAGITEEQAQRAAADVWTPNVERLIHVLAEEKLTARA